jgi:predicted ArsR family transcriptional regulator
MDDPQTPERSADELKTVELRDARALRAVAHPLRLSLLSLLRVAGPLTATQAARRLGESAQLCTYHLGQLARYGLAEEAGGGHGRERPWRATAPTTSWPNVARSPETALAAEQLEAVVVGQYDTWLRRWIAEKAREPREWQEAARLGDSLHYLTPQELAELDRAIRALLEPFTDRAEHPELRPAGSRPVIMLDVAFPLPESVYGSQEPPGDPNEGEASPPDDGR